MFIVLNLVIAGLPFATDDAAHRINAPVKISFQNSEFKKILKLQLKNPT
jgi:hypothetical protein